MQLVEAFRVSSSKAKSAPRPPVFLEPIAQACTENSSPYLDDFSQFEARFRDSGKRARLLDRLKELLAELRTHSIEPEAMLVGGSFVDLSVEPGDVDALIVYSIGKDADPGDATRFLGKLRTHPRDGLDVRFCPSDVGPVLLIKSVCFFHTLYMQTRDGRPLSKGSFLVVLTCSG